MSTSTMELFTPSTNKDCKRSMLSLEIQDLFDKILATCYPQLKDNENSIYESLEGEARKTYGDYAFLGVVDICDQLRKIDPQLFDHTRPKDIAEKIKRKFEYEKSKMITELIVREAGILTFRLEGHWMAKRIEKMLNDGMNTWAPVIYDGETGGKVVFVLPTTGRNAMARAIYMKDALVNMYLYSGADVGSGFCDNLALNEARERFTEKEGKIVSKMSQTSLFDENVPSDDVYADLATLWYGVKTQKADMMVYMTPHRLRGYIEQCHNAAAKEGWLPDDWKEIGTLTCCGFRKFFGKHTEVASWHILLQRDDFDEESIKNLGYTFEAYFQCEFRFTCLKSHRLDEPILEYNDFSNRENSFLSLLRTQDIVRSRIGNSPGGNFNLNALVGKERELGLHLVEFTEVIERACGGFVPHVVCEYLCNLSNLFICYDREVSPSENMLGLCKATEVVMNKCFDLLGIAPSSKDWKNELSSFLSQIKESDSDYVKATRKEALNSRFEIFSMNVNVAHNFDQGHIYGNVLVLDTYRSRADGWVRLDVNDDCHVSYFNREWYEAKHMCNDKYIPLGNPSSVHSIPFSSSIKVELLIKATSENEDQTYLLCNGNGTADLKNFWDGDSNTMCGTIKFDREDGRILLDYVAIKNAVDTKMQLTFNPVKDVKDVQLSGSITASYGEDVLGDCGFLGQYKALIFRAEPKIDIRCEEKPHSLPLYKSALAVPAKGCLKIKAHLTNVDSNVVIVDDTREFCESLDSIWNIQSVIGSFEFKVDWVHQLPSGSSKERAISEARRQRLENIALLKKENEERKAREGSSRKITSMGKGDVSDLKSSFRFSRPFAREGKGDVSDLKRSVKFSGPFAREGKGDVSDLKSSFRFSRLFAREGKGDVSDLKSSLPLPVASKGKGDNSDDSDDLDDSDDSDVDASEDKSGEASEASGSKKQEEKKVPEQAKQEPESTEPAGSGASFRPGTWQPPS